ncbi:MAG: hypothetical protein M1819_006647 [Sarea resinae]|nr:MAG: hypothetical protein M1819_006647 [Sarea resinae]
MKGLWITYDDRMKPDIAIYYCHGGGFSMGSSYFYLEFLLAWVSLLKEAGYQNPALFALEYTLVPDAMYPTQLQETIAGYDHLQSIMGDSSRICVGGDSAGATLILSLLLHVAQYPDYMDRRPGLSVCISPWTTLLSPMNRNTPSDYLDANTLHQYALQYTGTKALLGDPIASPGTCKDRDWWARASPKKGFFLTFGSEEVFAPETWELIGVLKAAGVHTEVQEQEGSIHAWPVVALFLGDTKATRQKGMQDIVDVIKRRMGEAGAA